MTPRLPRRRAAALLLLVPTLAVSACGGAGDAPSLAGAVSAEGPPEAQTATVVANARLAFAPETVRAQVGTLTLTMRIEGGVPHDLAFDDSGVGSPLPLIPSGSATQAYTFGAPGTYGFVCTVHSGMDGQVIVS